MKIIGGFILFLFAMVLLAAMSLVATGLWYCFDDRLALLLGIPALGTLPFTFVWAATLFISALFKSSHTTKVESK